MYQPMSGRYPYTVAPPRQFVQGTSSAFSPSANPDEDWTKISDLAERRRIQNRIAQRNYRKKLKKRLEDLEKQAADKTSPTGSASTSARGSSKRSPGNKVQKATAPPAPLPPADQKLQKQAMETMVPLPSPHRFSPPLQHDDYGAGGYGVGVMYERERTSRSPQPAYQTGYSTYPPPPDNMSFSLPPTQPHYRPVATTESQYGEYMTATSARQVTLPSLPSMSHFSDAMCKAEPLAPSYPGHHEQPSSLAPYSAALPVPYNHSGYLASSMSPSGAPSPYDNLPHTPPLSHSFNPSNTCSEAESYTYPTTPLSMPGSPESPNLRIV